VCGWVWLSGLFVPVWLVWLCCRATAAASFGFVDDLRDMPTQLNDVAAEFPTRVCVITSNKGEQRVPVLMYFLQKVSM